MNKPFKGSLKQWYTIWLLAGEYVLTPAGAVEKLMVQLLCQCLKWVSSEVVGREFEK